MKTRLNNVLWFDDKRLNMYEYFKMTEKSSHQALQSSSNLLHEGDFSGYVVGIGASAGGLEALEKFFKTCPNDTGLAFIVVQHLSPDYKSMMDELLSRYTKMSIQVVENGMELQPNQVFLIPPGVLMRLSHNKFKLTDKKPHTLTLPVDVFFNSIADAYGSKAIGVVLSGTGSDGTRGAYAINAAGGFLLAQDPGSSKFNGMPNSVIATGLVDSVLSAGKIAERIMKHVNNPIAVDKTSGMDGDAIPHDDTSAMELIFKLLSHDENVDFKDYKPATVRRRIERRMQVRRVSDLGDYAVLLGQDRSELINLRRELFIPVTSFFRDPQAYATLNEKVIKTIVENVSATDTIRVWCAGVATGEEPYTMAMSFMAMFEELQKWPTLKIFATDANQKVLDIAALGDYPESIAAEVKPSYLDKFFKNLNGGYMIRPEVRQAVVFAKHNLITDPPFTRMDLVSCRNTLIYFKNNAQEQALSRLHYAIKEGGYLFLGSSESLANQASAFNVVHAKHKIFQRSNNANPIAIDNTKMISPTLYSKSHGHSRMLDKARPVSSKGLVEQTQKYLLENFSPPAILVNSKHEAVHWFGDIKSLIEVRSGNASMEVIRILPDALVSVTMALLYKSIKDREVMVSDYVRVKLNDGRSRFIRVCVKPYAENEEDVFALVVFESQSHKLEGDATPQAVDVDEEIAQRVRTLQQELMATRESLQATIEELETSNEELQATNEELMASNEELQSSNEELQSVNEELNTVNAEYQEKMLHLNQANADLESMGKASGLATVFVDWKLKITRFTPDAVSLFNLIPGDIGRPLSDMRHRLTGEDLIGAFKQTMETGRLFEKQVTSENGLIYLMRILPYNLANSRYSGAVATFTDITAVQDKQSLQTILNALPENIAVLNREGDITLVNQAWNDFAKANGDTELQSSGVGTNYLQVCKQGELDKKDGLDSHQAYKGIKQVLDGQQNKFSLLYPCHSPNEERWFVMNVSPIIEHPQFKAVVSHSNISAWYEKSKN